MSRNGFGRREAIRLGLGTMVGALAVGDAAGQTDEALQLIGELAGKIKLPGKPLNMARAIAAILEMERDADRRGLALSPLAQALPPPLVPVEGSFYQSALPRLVALIDRNEKSDTAEADKAGEILASINAEERAVPDALKPAPLRLSTARDYASLKAEYRRMFDTIEVRPEFQEALDWHAKLISGAKLRYQQVAKEVGVPWYFIGAIHGLEASFNFRAHLHNGDFPLAQRTRQVPAGRPAVWLPPSDWESSAKDAIRLLGFANQSDWSLERTLFRLEAYNGFGYRRKLVPTPYLWCFSNHYDKGKYVADGKWSAEARSRQCGSAVLIYALAKAGEIELG